MLGRRGDTKGMEFSNRRSSLGVSIENREHWCFLCVASTSPLPTLNGSKSKCLTPVKRIRQRAIINFQKADPPVPSPGSRLLFSAATGSCCCCAAEYPTI